MTINRYHSSVPTPNLTVVPLRHTPDDLCVPSAHYKTTNSRILVRRLPPQTITANREKGRKAGHEWGVWLQKWTKILEAAAPAEVKQATCIIESLRYVVGGRITTHSKHTVLCWEMKPSHISRGAQVVSVYKWETCAQLRYRVILNSASRAFL